MKKRKLAIGEQFIPLSEIWIFLSRFVNCMYKTECNLYMYSILKVSILQLNKVMLLIYLSLFNHKGSLNYFCKLHNWDGLLILIKHQ